MGYTQIEDRQSLWKGIEDNIRLVKQELEDKNYAGAKKRLEYELQDDYELIPTHMKILMQSMVEKIDNGHNNAELITIISNIERRWM